MTYMEHFTKEYLDIIFGLDNDSLSHLVQDLSFLKSCGFFDTFMLYREVDKLLDIARDECVMRLQQYPLGGHSGTLMAR